MGAPFGAYVATWYMTDLAGDLYLWFLAWRELRRHGLMEGIRPTLRPETLPGAWRFAIHVNLTASVQAAWGPIARLVVGGLLGASGRRIVPGRVEPWPTAPQSPPICSPRPSTQRSCAWT